VLKDRHKDKDALKEYQTVLKIKPDHPSASEIKGQIDYLSNKADPRIP
jgi:hypothetical protein